jgi:hypothetical protein
MDNNVAHKLCKIKIKWVSATPFSVNCVFTVDIVLTLAIPNELFLFQNGIINFIKSFLVEIIPKEPR